MTTRSNVRALQAPLEVPQVAKSHDGYVFSPRSDRWELSKEVSFSLAFLRDLTPETNLGFRLALTRYAEEFSACHTLNMQQTIALFIRDTKASAVTVDALINWRSQLDAKHEWNLGGLKGFLLTWNGWGFPGVSNQVASLLRGWRLKGNEKGRAVAQGDVRRGPLTDIEVLGLLDWANGAFSCGEIELRTYAYLLTVLMTARRPVQIAALRGSDLTTKSKGEGTLEYVIKFPRAKQRGSGFRKHFRELSVIEDLYLTLQAQHQASLAKVKEALRRDVPMDLAREIPVFINSVIVDEISDLAALRDILMGDAPDRLHVPTGHLKYALTRCQAACTAKSERTGERIHLTSMRFRYTRGTNLRREGYGAELIAYALDQSDMRNVSTYTQDTAQEAEIINRVMGPRLAPYAQACMGTLVNSEREAIRGDDPRSRVPNHKQEGVGTCGNYGFCASGHRACYTCRHFQPWVDGPHEDVLRELYDEKQRAADAGCAREVVNASDRLILAVEQCVSLCSNAKAARRTAAQPPESPQKTLANG